MSERLLRDDGGTFSDVTAQSGDLAIGDAVGWVGTPFFDFDDDGDPALPSSLWALAGLGGAGARPLCRRAR